METNDDHTNKRSSGLPSYDRRYQGRQQATNGRPGLARIISTALLNQSKPRPSRTPIVTADDHNDDDTRSTFAGNPSHHHDTDAHSAINQADDNADIQGHHQSVGRTVRRFPTVTRLRTSELTDPYLGQSVSSVAPTAYSFSGCRRANALRRNSSVGTFSEEEFDIKYRSTRDARPPSRMTTDVNTDNVAGPSHVATYKCRSEHLPHSQRDLDGAERPQSEIGTPRSRKTKQASRFTVNDDVIDSEIHRYMPIPSWSVGSFLKERTGQTTRSDETPLQSRDKPNHGSSGKYDYISWETEAQETEISTDVCARSVLSAVSSRSRNLEDSLSSRSVLRAPNPQMRHKDASVASLGSSRDLRPLCDAHDIGLKDKPEEQPIITNRENTTSPRTDSRDGQRPRTGSATAVGSEAIMPRAQASTIVHAGRSPKPDGLQVGRTSPVIRPQANSEQDVNASDPPLAQSQYLLKSPETPRGATPEQSDPRGILKGPQSSQRPLQRVAHTANSITFADNGAHLLLDGKTEDSVAPTAARDSEYHGRPSLQASLDKAVQVNIAQPDKRVIACTLISGALTIALVAVVLFAVLGR